MMDKSQYSAFLSYSHKDQKVGSWLHKQLEQYRIPANLIGTTTPMGVVPSSIGRIFMDRDELAVTDDLTHEVKKALAGSRFMIVLCSPSAAASRWVNKEIIEYKKMFGEKNILPIIVEGTPFASKHNNPKDECFPPALRYKLAAHGGLSAIELEPAAADLRREADGKRRAVLKLIAGMLGVGLDQLIERDLKRRHRRVMSVTAGSLVGMLAMSFLTYEAVTARRDAEYHRGEAEDLIEFMLTDLREKLEPVGRLDVLDSVGEKVVSYYNDQLKYGDMSDDAIGRKARAYHLLGEMQFLRDHPDQASALFKQSAEATETLLLRDPNNTQRIYEHALSVYWFGNQRIQRGDIAAGEKAWMQYKQYAEKLVSLEPEKEEWQIELGYADRDVGAIHLQYYQDAKKGLPYLEKSLATFLAAYKKNPDSGLLKTEVALSYSWLVDAVRQMGNSDTEQTYLDLVKSSLDDQIAEDPNNQMTKENLMVWHVNAAWHHLDLGEVDKAKEQYAAAQEISKEWLKLEPEATAPFRSKIYILYSLAEVYFNEGKVAEAKANIQEADNLTAALFAKPEDLEPWWQILRVSSLVLKLKLAADQNQYRTFDKDMDSVGQEVSSIKEALKSRQDGRMVLVSYYALLIKNYLSTGDIAAAEKARAEVWALVDGDNYNQVPKLLKSLMAVSDMVGDEETTEKIQSILHARGYLSL